MKDKPKMDEKATVKKPAPPKAGSGKPGQHGTHGGSSGCC
jgi:hypothetical protein